MRVVLKMKALQHNQRKSRMLKLLCNGLLNEKEEKEDTQSENEAFLVSVKTFSITK